MEENVPPPRPPRNFFSSIHFVFVNDFMDNLSKASEVRPSDAYVLFDGGEVPGSQADVFDAEYRRCLTNESSSAKATGLRNNKLFKTLTYVNRTLIFEWVGWTCLEVANRMASRVPVVYYVKWLYTGDEPYWLGYVLAIVFGITILLHHFFMTKRSWATETLMYNIKYQVPNLLFSKVLKLNSATISKTSTGSLLNMVIGDLRALDMVVTWGLFAPAALIEMIAVFVILIFRVGIVSAISGVGILFISIPVQIWSINEASKCQREASKLADERLRLTSEAMQGVLTVKSQSWEEPMLQSVLSVRQKEEEYLKKKLTLRVVNFAIGYVFLPISLLLTIIPYLYLGHTVTPVDLVFIVGFLLLPRISLILFFALSAQSIANGYMAVERLNNFLEIPEPPPPPYLLEQAPHLPRGTIVMNGANYDWEYTASQAPDLPSSQAASPPMPPRDPRIQLVLHSDPVLTEINLEVKPKELLAVVGTIGAGKSSLFAAILGELQAVPPPGTRRGTLPTEPTVIGSVAYAPQQPWLIPGTIRENILFGQEFDRDWYTTVISACDLTSDLVMLPDGDMTVLGVNGTGLSGGQKARVSLARAAYTRADIILFDDPISSLDARVARHVFTHVIGPNGILNQSTRILSTHLRQYLRYCDRTLVLREGHMVALGSWDELKSLDIPELSSSALMAIRSARPSLEMFSSRAGGLYRDRLDRLLAASASLTSARASAGPEPEISRRSIDTSSFVAAWNREVVERLLSSTSTVPEVGGPPAATGAPRLPPAPPGRVTPTVPLAMTATLPLTEGSLLSTQDVETLEEEEDEGGKGLEESSSVPSSAEEFDIDKLEQGRPSMQERERPVVAQDSKPFGLGKYFGAMGGLGIPIFVVLLMFFADACYLVSLWWIIHSAQAGILHDVDYIVFASLTGGVVVCQLLAAYFIPTFLITAGHTLHNNMMRGIFGTRYSFFQSESGSKVVDSIARDVGSVDDTLPPVLHDLVAQALTVLAIVVMMIIAIPFAVVLLVGFGFYLWWVWAKFSRAVRHISRMNAQCSGPLTDAFLVAEMGLPIIRCTNSQERLKNDFKGNSINSAIWNFALPCSIRWLDTRICYLTDLISICVAIMGCALKDWVPYTLMGLVLLNAMTLALLLPILFRHSATILGIMNGVERVVTYSELPQENDEHEKDAFAKGRDLSIPVGWPASAFIQFDNVSVSYDPTSSLVIRDLSVEMKGGTTVCVIGRTGSGKSTLVLSLFRMVSVRQGTIYFDGLDTAIVPLQMLRAQMAIIPQEPVLFSGTFRVNLDPWGLLTDDLMWVMLNQVGLGQTVSDMGGLDASIDKGSRKLSLGQKQLMCLARAFLKDAWLIALDEATASIDYTTEVEVQRTLHTWTTSSSAGRVLLIVAHRLSATESCDQLLVMSDGQLVEEGHPSDLVSVPGGYFASMMAAAKSVTTER